MPASSSQAGLVSSGQTMRQHAGVRKVRLPEHQVGCIMHQTYQQLLLLVWVPIANIHR